MDESIRKIIQTLGRREREFKPDREADANQLAGQQLGLWTNLAKNLSSTLNLDENTTAMLDRFFASLVQDIDKPARFKVEQFADSNWYVQGKYPILEKAFIADAVKYSDILTGGIIVEMCYTFAVLGENTDIFSEVVTHPLFSLFCMKYMTLREAERSTKTGEAILKDMQEQAGSVRSAAQMSYREVEKSIENMKASVETHVSESRSNLVLLLIFRQ